MRASGLVRPIGKNGDLLVHQLAGGRTQAEIVIGPRGKGVGRAHYALIEHKIEATGQRV